MLLGDTFVGYGRVIRVDDEQQTVPIQWLKQARIPVSKARRVRALAVETASHWTALLAFADAPE